MSQVDQLEKQLEDSKVLVERRKLAIKLVENPDFKKLILEFFCVEECARYVHASCDPTIPEENQKDALALAQAAGHFKRFLAVVLQMGFQAENNLTGLEEAIIEAREEEDQA